MCCCPTSKSVQKQPGDGEELLYNMSQIKSWFRKMGRAHLWILLGSAVGMRAFSLVWNNVWVVLCVKENQHRARDVVLNFCTVALISVKAIARPPWQADWRAHACTLSPLWVFWLRAIFKVRHSLQRKKNLIYYTYTYLIFQSISTGRWLIYKKFCDTERNFWGERGKFKGQSVPFERKPWECSDECNREWRHWFHPQTQLDWENPCMPLLHYVSCMMPTFPGRLFSHSGKSKTECWIPGTSPAVCPQEEWPPPRQRGHAAVRASPGTAAAAPGRLYLRGGQTTKHNSLWEFTYFDREARAVPLNCRETKKDDAIFKFLVLFIWQSSPIYTMW